jgi:hypothetical protein
MKPGELHMKKTLTSAVLCLVALLSASPVPAAVQVYGEAASTGPNIGVKVYADITGATIVSHSFKLFYDAGQLQVLGAHRNEAVWYFHDGISVLPQSPPVTTPAGEVLFVSGYMDARNPHTGVTGNRVLLGTVEFARNGSATPGFNLTIGRAGQFANFVNIDGAVLEAQVGQVVMQSVTPNPDDQDLDGLSDQWEDKFFGGTRGVFYSDDPDKDGVNNLGEEALGSDPTDSRSNLRLAISDRRDVLLLEWDSVEDRSYTIEVSKEIGRFEPLKEGIKATPPLNTYELDRRELEDARFFRIRVDVPSVP